MKTTLLRHNRRISIALAALFSAFLLAGTISATAYNGYGNNNSNWNNNGNAHANQYYHQGHYYPYAYHNNHRGYWQNNNGVRLFIVL